MRFEGKVAIVTGGALGIGAGIVKVFGKLQRLVLLDCIVLH